MHYCAKGRECVVNSKGMAECVCQRYCAHRKKPICGTDGMVYENHCELHRAACILERPITFQKMEKCSTISKKKVSAKKLFEKPKKFMRVTSPPEMEFDFADVTQQQEQQPQSETNEQERHETIVILKETTPLPYVQKDDVINKDTETMLASDFNHNHLIETNIDANVGDALSVNDPMSTDSTSSEQRKTIRKGYCSAQEYEIMKDNLLLYSHTRLMSQDNNHSKDFLVSIMFSHYDQNNNGHLEQEELSQITMTEHLEDLSNGCLLNDMLIFDDVDNDRQLSINEFYQAFNKLYSKFCGEKFFSNYNKR